MKFGDSPKRSSRRLADQLVVSTDKSKRVAGLQPSKGSTVEGFDSVNISALSNERIRMTAVNTQDSMYQAAYGNRSNISEINEADFS